MSADDPPVCIRPACSGTGGAEGCGVLQDGDNPAVEEQYGWSPGLDDAMAAMETAEINELAKRKRVADMLSEKQTELNDLVSVYAFYIH